MDRDIRLALLGDHEAAKRLTDAGVLIPCPFCSSGGRPELRVQEVEYGVCGAWVVCAECGSKTNYMGTHEFIKTGTGISTPMTEESRQRGINKARLAWNTRAPILSESELKKLEETT